MGNRLKSKLTMFKRWFYILSGKSNTAIKQDEGKYYSKNHIAGYYNDLTGKVNSGTIIDDKGIPLTKIDGGEFVYFPIAIFQYGLGCYDLYLGSHKIEYLNMLKKQADWAIENQTEIGSWDCFGPLKSDKYTVSSMAQGEGASMLIRAYTAFNKRKYLDAAKKAIDFMLSPVVDGGTAIYSEDKLYLEEYPQVPQRSVMNGWIFSMFGLYDMSLIEHEAYIHKFEKSAAALSGTLDKYDCGYWSYYDLERRIASPAYHELHIALLNVMFDITGNGSFKETAEKFKQYQSSKVKRVKAITRKIIQKLTEKSEMVVIQ